MKLCPCRISKKKAGRGSNIIVFSRRERDRKIRLRSRVFFRPPLRVPFLPGALVRGPSGWGAILWLFELR